MRLIDADKLKVEIANYFLSCVDKGKIVIDITEMQVELYKIINLQPTVYNLEKIVEELERKKRTSVECLGERNGTGFNKVMDLAIDIVKRGGVE